MDRMLTELEQAENRMEELNEKLDQKFATSIDDIFDNFGNTAK